MIKFGLDEQLSEFYVLASGECKKLLESYDREREHDNSAKIEKLLKEAESFRYNKSYTEEYVKDIVKVLCIDEAGEIGLMDVAKMGSVEKTRMANEEKVLEYTKKAASLGSLKALTTVGKCYLGGYGCKRQTMNAIALLCRADDTGSKEARRLLERGDECYAEDLILRIPLDIIGRTGYDSYYVNNLTNVKFWEKRESPVAELERFAASGMYWAKYILGDMYLRGNPFVEKDFNKGVELILSAADEGHVQRAIKAKALLQFDKLIELNGQNNVDAAFATYWTIENLRVRREAQAEMLARTSLVECDAGKVDLKLDSRGAQLVWRAIKRFKEANNASWITLPDSSKKCEELSKSMFGDTYSYDGSRDKVTSDDGKTHYYRSPFLGKDGLFGTHGILFNCRCGLKGNLHSEESPNYKFEYNCQYNYSIGEFDFPKGLWDVDIMWLFRGALCLKRKNDSRVYVDWGLGGPVNFKPAGFSEIDLLTLIDYVRRCVFSDLRKGVRLCDGSIQKGQFSSKLELPMGPSNHTLLIAEALGGKQSAVTSPTGGNSRKKSSSGVSTSQKKRWKFVLLGLFLGVLGLHFLYANRKGWFFLYWLAIAANVAQMKVPMVKDAIANISPGLATVPVFGLLAALIFLGSIFFMKKDGAGNRM